MTGISQSALLQALGWATLNSFWQVGLLWCAYALARRIKPIAAGRQYSFAILALGVSFASFAGSMWFYLQGGARETSFIASFSQVSKSWFNIILTAASLAYLFLLLVPGSRLIQNWIFLRRLRRSQLSKAPVQYRLYVQKIAGHLGLRKPVKVYFSALVQSPVTIGYLKPLILLPVAGFNQLTVQQAEAVLLHELAHIRRYDYLVNIGISFIATILYFNPFIRMFVKVAEAGREECCDTMVLQFGYDRLAYAGALLQLEKSAATLPQFALGATGKSQLLSRIEAIVGMPRKIPALRIQHFTGLLASVLSVLALHSLFIIGKKEGSADPLQTFARFASPFSIAYQESETVGDDLAPVASNSFYKQHKAPVAPAQQEVAVLSPEEWIPAPPAPEPAPPIVQVANIEDPMTRLAVAEQQQVAATVDATRKVLTTMEWQELEKAIADGLTEAEKMEVQTEYYKEIEQINWKQIEANLANRYHETNWEQVNQYLNEAAQKIQSDSLETSYTKILAQLEEISRKHGLIALPDQPVQQIENLKLQLCKAIDSLKAVRLQPVIRF